MVSLVAALAIMGAAFQGLAHFQQRLSTQHRVMASTQDLRLGVQVMETEIRQAGTGNPAIPPVQKAEAQELEFQANVFNLTAMLTTSASVGQVDLTVDNGSGWSKGKRIVICSIGQCAEYRLARDGRNHGLSLTTSLNESFPAGSVVMILNQIRYYLRNDGQGRWSVMRMVDGGANALMGDVGRFALTYFDKHGSPVRDPAQVVRVRIEIDAAERQWQIVREVGLRGM
jgi:hypothetical protein